MLSTEDKDYLLSLSRVKRIQRLLHAFDIADPALVGMLRKLAAENSAVPSRSEAIVRLDTTNSNISRDTLQKCRRILPPDLVREIAEHDRIRSYLQRIYYDKMGSVWRKRGDRVGGCRQSHMVLFSVVPQEKPISCIIPYACMSRCCPACSREKSRKTLNRVLDKVQPTLDAWRKNIKWITFTVQNATEGALESAIADLLKGFRRLRQPRIMNGKRGAQDNCWTEGVRGYLWNLEVTHNDGARTWHPHIHVVFAGDFIPWETLKAEWEKALSPTGRLGDIKIGEAYSRDACGMKTKVRNLEMTDEVLCCFREICKYTFKPFESSLPSECIIELTDALFNKRLSGSGGIWTLPPEQTRNAWPYWALEGGLQAVSENLDNSPYSRLCQKAILSSCSKHHAQWLRIVRNYDLYYWIKRAEYEKA